MNLLNTNLSGVCIIEHEAHEDCRGQFFKNFNKSSFNGFGLDLEFRESYFTFSRKGVIRGMHFQTPPHDHFKLVTVIEGSISDVVIDLRRGSPTYLQYMAVELSSENRRSVYIPRGCAHGFLSLSESAIIHYMVTSEHAPDHDSGIRFDSFGYDWKIKEPIVSLRDLNLPGLNEFKDYFV